MRTRSWVVEVGGATDDHYANLTPQIDKFDKFEEFDKFVSYTLVNRIVKTDVSDCGPSSEMFTFWREPSAMKNLC